MWPAGSSTSTGASSPSWLRPLRASSTSTSPGSDRPVAGPPEGRRLLGRADVSRLLTDSGIHPSRALGQNFVIDPNTVERIVRLAGVGSGDQVLEIGPGLGSLTLALAAGGASVLAVELDKRLAALLPQTVAGLDVEVVQGDALTVDWPALLGGGPWVAVANLPYNVATPVVLRLLEEAPSVERMLVMVQREVGERWAAGPGNGAYGAVSVKMAWWATTSLAGTVPASVFVPQPKVESVLVRVERRDPPPGADRRDVFDLIEAGFATRRKMLRRALAGRVDEAQFAAAGIGGTRRAEELGLDDWVRLAGVTQ